MAVLTVWNSGPPIPPEDLPKIFDRFHRVDRSRTSSSGHTGLGLAIVQGIVQAHGGRVHARSSDAEGTCFTVHLPAAPGTEESGGEQRVQAPVG
jgi:signal transduction histidine kinase